MHYYFFLWRSLLILFFLLCFAIFALFLFLPQGMVDHPPSWNRQILNPKPKISRHDNSHFRGGIPQKAGQTNHLNPNLKFGIGILDFVIWNFLIYHFIQWVLYYSFGAGRFKFRYNIFSFIYYSSLIYPYTSSIISNLFNFN